MKTIANGITNLTDARYFSAMNVDWIGYDMRPDSGLSIEHLIAFSEWVEGPDFLVDVRGRTESEIGEILADFEASGLILDTGVNLGNYTGEIIRSASDDGGSDIVIGSLEELEGAGDDHSSDMWAIANTTDDVKRARALGVVGIVLNGGDEQDVGLKDYELLDALFDAING